MKQGKHHMGGTKRYVKNMMNIPASRNNIKEKFPTKAKSATGKSKVLTTIADQPTRKMLGVRIVKGGK